MKKLLLSFLIALSLLNEAYSESYFYNTPYQVCFTPEQDCTSLIVIAINNAKESIYVQAYSFTSVPIAQALVAAKRRGVEVDVILDKTQSKSNKYTSSTFLANSNIPVWIDYKPAIAHNKIIIIDKAQVITGSFNFTKAAQDKNAENVLIITNDELAKRYLENWNKRQAQSRAIN